jgi:hypothetical protein
MTDTIAPTVVQITEPALALMTPIARSPLDGQIGCRHVSHTRRQFYHAQHRVPEPCL